MMRIRHTGKATDDFCDDEKCLCRERLNNSDLLARCAEILRRSNVSPSEVFCIIEAIEERLK